MIRVKRKLNSTDVVDALTDLFILRGPPRFISSDNGAEFIAEKVRAWIAAVGAKTAFIEPGSPWEIGYYESFNARFRDELLNGEVLSYEQPQFPCDTGAVAGHITHARQRRGKGRCLPECGHLKYAQPWPWPVSSVVQFAKPP